MDRLISTVLNKLYVRVQKALIQLPKVSGARVGMLAVESYGNWGKEAQNTFARLASILSILP